MGRKLHGLLAALKDTAVLTAAATSPTDIAVLRATPHHHPSTPPSSSSLSALLSFGDSTRLSATALVRSLSSRLSSSAAAGDPSVALKALICLHHLLTHSSFILSDALSSSLAPSSGRRSPLNLSSYKSSSSIPLSSCVRWYARLLELLLSVRSILNGHDDDLTSLLNKHLIAELDSLTTVIQELNLAPDTLTVNENGVVVEVMRRAEAERVNMQVAIRVRVRELKERLTELGFADSVEIACLFRRLEGCRLKWKDWELFWSEVREVREKVERREEREGGKVIKRRETVSESARVGSVRVEDEPVVFGSSRGFKCLS